VLFWECVLGYAKATYQPALLAPVIQQNERHNSGTCHSSRKSRDRCPHTRYNLYMLPSEIPTIVATIRSINDGSWATRDVDATNNRRLRFSGHVKQKLSSGAQPIHKVSGVVDRIYSTTNIIPVRFNVFRVTHVHVRDRKKQSCLPQHYARRILNNWKSESRIGAHQVRVDLGLSALYH